MADDRDVYKVLAVLANERRLAVVRTVSDAGADGMSAGEIAESNGYSLTATSNYLAALTKVGLLNSERVGRTIVFRCAASPLERLTHELADMAEASKRKRRRPLT